VPISAFHFRIALNRGQTIFPTLRESAMICEIEVALRSVGVGIERHCFSIRQINGVGEQYGSITPHETTGETNDGIIGAV